MLEAECWTGEAMRPPTPTTSLVGGTLHWHLTSFYGIHALLDSYLPFLCGIKAPNWSDSTITSGDFNHFGGAIDFFRSLDNASRFLPCSWAPVPSAPGTLESRQVMLYNAEDVDRKQDEVPHAGRRA